MDTKWIAALAAGWAAACLSLAGQASAGVITGTGVPSSSTLGATDAVGYVLSSKGPGHALVVPYFTAQAGQMSVLHLVNVDTTNGKVVKLRYRGAGNGDSLFSVQVLLSPGDVWTAAVTAGPDGISQIVTADRTCTYPALAPGVAQPFLTDRLNPAWSAEQRANNTREGLVEAIVMADVPPQTSLNSLHTAIRHINGVAPCTPGVLDAALLPDYTNESTAAAAGFATPTGGLAGTWYIIDVPGSTTFSGAATALRAVNAAGKTARGNFMLFPQTNGAVDQPERYTSDPLLVSAGLASRGKNINGVTSQPTTAAAIVARSHDLPDLSTPYYLPASAINARTTAGDLNRLLGVTAVRNQYAIDASISAKTDWVFSLPTKRYSVAYDYSQPAQTALVYSVVPPGGVQDFFTDNQKRRGEAACSEHPRTIFSRERDSKTQGAVIMIPDPGVFVCGVASVLAFQDAGRSSLAASVTRDTLTSVYNNGWLDVRTLSGTLPIRGAAFFKLTNPNATPGVAGTYGLVFPHLDDAP